MDEHNPAFTGFFSDRHKRIDLVLVIADGGSSKAEEMRINYLKNVIKFGLELELDEGQLFEHRNLIFVKVHAPDSIIEEYGLYFSVRKFFKDVHVDHVNRLLNPLGIKHERELIKLIRKQYPGPGNYSTLERSKIVYNIIHRLPFGQHKELFGINQLLELNIIIDVFALHDGPYFLASAQSTCINARQSLFYYWTGVRNILTAQPIHMIQEYLGETVAMYFAYYEFFNCMLLFPAIVGVLVTVTHYYGDTPALDKYAHRLCYYYYLYQDERNHYICPQCRHFDLCPFRPVRTYCKELKFLSTIDTSYMKTFAFFVSIWGIVFAVIWKRKYNYLMWMWEAKQKYINNIINPEYYKFRQFYTSRFTRLMLWFMFGFLSVAFFGVWLFTMFVLSTQIWYVKYWLDKIYNKAYYGTNATERYNEYLFIGMGAGVYSILTTALKPIARMLSHKLTTLENNKTLGLYSCSLALKLYGFYFTGTFALLTLHVFVGSVFYTHLLDERNWYSISGFKVMNNGLGTSLDDMCITLAVAVVIEQIIVKVPLYFKRKATDCEVVFNKNTPTWEREYKLGTLKDDYFHHEYCNIAIQFAMATLFSLTFPLAPLLILLINIWDMRHKARDLLLTYRRPLHLDRSAPDIWHKIILFTSYFVPIMNICIIALQSRNFIINRAFYARGFINNDMYIKVSKGTFKLLKGIGSPKEELKNLPKGSPNSCWNAIYDHWFYRSAKKKFVREYQSAHVQYYKSNYIVLYSVIGVLINLFIHSEFPTHSSDIVDTENIEWRIKQKYYIKKGFLPNNEE